MNVPALLALSILGADTGIALYLLLRWDPARTAAQATASLLRAAMCGYAAVGLWLGSGLF